jgi:hypothetical protein
MNSWASFRTPDRESRPDRSFAAAEAGGKKIEEKTA